MPAAGAGSSVDARLKGRVALADGPVSIAPESIHLHRTCLWVQDDAPLAFLSCQAGQRSPAALPAPPGIPVIRCRCPHDAREGAEGRVRS